MRWPAADGGERLLTYCSNVHPGESVAAVQQSLESVALAVKAALAPDERFGLGLWLPRGVVDELLANRRKQLRAFRAWLDQRGLFVFTANAFPIGGFHADRVKEKVFEPSWADRARLEYTRRAATVLAALLPEGTRGSISTLPLGLPAIGFDRVAAIEHLRSAGRHLKRLERETGRHVVLSIEPEPSALLETVADAVAFLKDEVFTGPDDPLRRFVGVCLDACHEAVMHQDPERTLELLERERIAVGKVQISSALELEDPARNAEGTLRLRRFDEGRYFHQAVHRRRDGTLEVHQELGDFFDALRGREDLEDLERVRVHFHVPVFAAGAPDLKTTRADLERMLALLRDHPVTDQFEVETYTFDVIPEAEREALGAGDLPAALALELEWARERL